MIGFGQDGKRKTNGLVYDSCLLYTSLAFPSECDAFKYTSGRGEVFICFHTDVLIGALGERGLHATYAKLRQTLLPPGILIPDCDGKVTRNIGGTRGVQISWTRLVEVLSHQ